MKDDEATFLLLVFGVGNGVLYDGQEFLHAGDEKAFEELRTEMERREHQLKLIEVELQTLKSRIETVRSRIAQLKAEITAIESRYGETGAPSDVYDRYQGMIDEHNRRIDEVNPIRARFSALIATYNAKVDAYNRDVPRINELADKAFSRWYLIPIPGRSSRSRVPAKPLIPAPAR